ncbi:hypothetical protein C8Q75DRAFT_726425 [Abortiporus biennis]|nr:hypothetical protein C8Q75DRAFT_726425 [Abortiporus biennis]
MADSSITTPNPTTPLAYLQPNIARQTEVTRYVFAATIGSFAWDYLMSMKEDFDMIFRTKFRWTDILYLLSRSLTIAFLIQSLVFTVGPASNCQALALSVGWCYGIAMPLNSLLFFVRLQTIFSPSPTLSPVISKMITGVFSLLWLATLSCFTAPFATKGATHIGLSKACLEDRMEQFGSIGPVLVFIYDLLIWLAVHVRLTLSRIHGKDGSRSWSTSFWSRDGLSKGWKIFTSDAQLFYLASIIINIFSIIIMFTGAVPTVYRFTVEVPNVALQNAMACRVYRHLKLGYMTDYRTATNTSSNGNTTSGGGGVHGAATHAIRVPNRHDLHLSTFSLSRGRVEEGMAPLGSDEEKEGPLPSGGTHIIVTTSKHVYTDHDGSPNDSDTV